jgi:hypothetical protein
MIRSAKSLEGCELHARDGTIGRIRDVYFDDEHWTVRYLVVDAGTWLTGRTVLIAATALGRKEWESGAVAVDLTKEQVRNSPSVDAHQPVTRQQELALHDYYGWPYYWTAPVLGTGGVAPIGQPVPATAPLRPDRPREPASGEGSRQAGEGKTERDSHLRSVHSTRGYHIEASDGSIGHVDDFLIEDADWSVRFLVVDTRNWWPGKKVIVAPSHVLTIDWAGAAVRVKLTRDAIKSGPEFEEQRSVTAEYTDRLEAHYRRFPGGTAVKSRQDEPGGRG